MEPSINAVHNSDLT